MLSGEHHRKKANKSSMVDVDVFTRIRILDALHTMLGEREEMTEDVIEIIEQSLFQKDKMNLDAYIENAKRVSYNLSVNSKGDNSRFVMDFVAFLTDDQLCSSRVKDFEREERHLFQSTMEMLKKRVDTGKVTSDAAVHCKKCKSSEISVQQKQTRSADEGATVFFTCKTCGFVWKMS